MSRIIYWSIMAGAALMAGTLLALPLWDYYHYRQPTSGDLPTSPTTLAVMTGAPVPPSFYPSAEPAARSRPPGETDPAPSPVSRPGSADRQSDGQVRMSEPAPNLAHRGNASPAVRAATPSSPVAGRPTAGASQPRIGASPTEQGVGSTSRAPAGGSPQEHPQPAVNQAASIGWIAGGSFPGSPSMPATGPQSTAPNHDRPGQNDESQPSESEATVPEPQDAPSLRLTLAPDRHAVSRGETISVAVALTGARDVTSVPFHLQFDPGVLQYVGTRTGPALNGRSLQPIFLASVNPDRPGDLAVGLSFVRSSGTFNGSGAILLIDFLALGRGRSDLHFDRASVRGPTSEPLTAEVVGSTAEVR